MVQDFIDDHENTMQKFASSLGLWTCCRVQQPIMEGEVHIAIVMKEMVVGMAMMNHDSTSTPRPSWKISGGGVKRLLTMTKGECVLIAVFVGEHGQHVQSRGQKSRGQGMGACLGLRVHRGTPPWFSRASEGSGVAR